MVFLGERHEANWALEWFLSNVDFLLMACKVARLGENFIKMCLKSHRCPRCALGDQKVPADVA